MNNKYLNIRLVIYLQIIFKKSQQKFNKKKNNSCKFYNKLTFI